MVHLRELLSTLADAVQRAGGVIREVHAAGGNKGILKDAADPRTVLTEADTRAQRLIISAIRRMWPELSVVGEEDEEGDAGEGADLSKTLLDGLPQYAALPDLYTHLPCEHLCVFIDPVDGTREFVNGNLEAVQTLVGVALHGRPIAGVIGVPFVGSPQVVITGMVDVGVAGVPAPIHQRPEGKCVLAGSKDGKDPVLDEVRKAIACDGLLPLGACGNKVLSLLTGSADVCLFNMATSLWDTCATEAVLVAAGGKMTDLFGGAFRYTPSARRHNRYGVVASRVRAGHGDLVARIRSSKAALPLLSHTGIRCNGEVQATDVARDVDGEPLTAEWLSHHLKCKVEEFSAPEESAVRYLQSDAVRLVVTKGDTPGASIFFKRMVMREIEHVITKARTTPAKLARDVVSYRVEADFLNSRICHQLHDSGVPVPKAFDIQHFPIPDSPIDSRFSLLLEDFHPDKWRQRSFLSLEETTAALQMLARYHAFFWEQRLSPEDKAELNHSVWEHGTHWALMQQGMGHVKDLPEKWAEIRLLMREPFEEAGLFDGCANLGRRLAAVAVPLDKKLHGTQHGDPMRTVLHGDPKAANLFFMDAEEGEIPKVAVIDFQWAGWGVPMVDIAYFIAAGCSIGLLTHDGEGERKLVETYHRALGDAGVSVDFSDLWEQYKYAFLDLARVGIGYHWARTPISPEVLAKRAHLLGPNAYNKSIPHAVWFLARALRLLEELEPALLQ